VKLSIKSSFVLGSNSNNAFGVVTHKIHTVRVTYETTFPIRAADTVTRTVAGVYGRIINTH